MKTNTKILIINSFMIIVLLSIPTSASSVRDWNVGDAFNYKLIISEKEIYVNEVSNLRDVRTVYAMDSELKYVVTAIDDQQKEASANLSTAWFESESASWNCSATNTSQTILDRLFQFEYHWDEVANQSRLTSFLMWGESYYFVVDPDWISFNDVFANIGNRDRIIDTVSYNSTLLNITFGDFLDSVPHYQFMGVQGFPDSSNGLGPAHEWKFEFTFDNFIYKREYDPVHHNYTFTPYTKYNATCLFKYTEGGTLIENTYFEKKIITDSEDIPYIIETLYTFYNRDLREANTSLTSYSAIISIMVMPVLLLFYKRKKK
jgi:hypothetical protein